MTNRKRNYLSFFSLHFIDSICGLARASQFNRQHFRAKQKPLLDFFNPVRRNKTVKDNPTVRQLRLAVWSVVVITWVLAITALAFLNLSWWGVLIVVVIVLLSLPFVLLRVAAWCLPKSRIAR